MDQGKIAGYVRMLAASEQARRRGVEALGGAESELPPNAVPEAPGEILELLEAGLTRPSESDPEAWCKARDLLLRHAGSALSKLGVGDLAFDVDEAGSMEALIVADGTRPSFLLRDGEVAPDAPFIDKWGVSVAVADAVGLNRLAAAVGRIQPDNGSARRFIGTGSLIDQAAGLVLTNYHVLKQAQSEYGVSMTRNGNRVTINGTLEIDFCGESHSDSSNRFRLVEAFLPAGFGSVFAGLDAAVLRIEPVAGGLMPKQVECLSTASCYAAGELPSLAIIGYPAAPKIVEGDGLDWNFVIGTLFGNQFGVKRIAPGEFTRKIGSHPEDAVAKRAFGHDATSFGGASGALVSAWQSGRTPCFGLHFGGQTGVSNYAVAFAAVRDVLEAIGVRFSNG